MADYSAYESEGNQYSFSKGPKSLYAGGGDPGYGATVVLPVPQTDVDDEWGGTQRIADERIADFIAELRGAVLPNTVFPNADLTTRLNALMGAGAVTPLAYIPINLATPSMKLGDILLNGSANTITLGTQASLSESALVLGTNFIITTGSDAYLINFKDKNTIQFYNNDVDPASTEIIVRDGVGATNYRFTRTSFTIPSGATMNVSDLTVSGTLTTANIMNSAALVTNTLQAISSANFYTVRVCGVTYPGTDASHNLGSPVLRWLNLYLSGTANLNDLSLTGTLTGAVGSVIDMSGTVTFRGDVNFQGQSNFNAPVVVAGVFHSSPFSPAPDIGTFTLPFKDLYLSGAVNAPTVTTNNLGAVAANIGALTLTGTAGTITLLPTNNAAYDIGGLAPYMYRDLYLSGTATVNSLMAADSVTVGSLQVTGSTHLAGLQVCGVVNPGTDDLHNLGSLPLRWRNLYLSGTATAGELIAGSATINGNLLTQNVVPLINNTYFVGGPASALKGIYFYDADTTTIRILFICGGAPFII